VDLLVGGDRTIIVTEERAENLFHASRLDVEGVEPVDDTLPLPVALADLLLEVARAVLRRFEEAILARQQESGGEAVDRAGNRIGLLDAAAQLAAVQKEIGAILPVVDLAALELGANVEVADLADLVDPPVLLLEDVIPRLAARKDQVLGLKLEVA